MSKPNLIIAGVNKAGTTSLFAYLSQHPDVCASSVKEACYFLPLRYDNEIMSDVHHYQDMFCHCNDERVIVEATPGYFYGGERLATAIHDFEPNAKIILVLRDPVTRLISFFNFMKSMLYIEPDMTMQEYVHRCQMLDHNALRLRTNNPYFGVEGGFYNNYIHAWLDKFGENLKIVFFEDLKNDPRRLMMNLCQWLALDEKFFDDFNFSISNKTAHYKHRHIHAAAIAVNRKLEKLLRRNPWVKKVIKRLYTRINLESCEKNKDSIDLDSVRELYAESNIMLAKTLKSREITQLPAWLEVR